MFGDDWCQAAERIVENPWECFAASDQLVLDWDSVPELLGLDQDETALFRVNRIDGVPRRKAHTALGWSSARVARVARRIERKVARLQPASDEPDRVCRSHSVNPAYLESLATGHRCWSLEALDETFAEIMSAEMIRLQVTDSTKTVAKRVINNRG